jgi:hypothetical protein
MKKKIPFLHKPFPSFLHLLMIIIVIIAIRASFYAATDGFSLYKIDNTFPASDEWKLSPPNAYERQKIHAICEKPFYYLAKGSQAYAFISDDGEYVLKLFKCYHLTPVTWLEKLPLPQSLDHWRDETIQKRQKKIDATLQSYKIAENVLKKECGILALEILPSPSFQQEVEIVDKIGRQYRLNLANYGFILQKKADLIYPTLSRWIKEGNISQAKKALTSIVDLVIQRSKKGIQDSDPDLHKNAGLIGTKAVFIDVGSFHKNLNAKNPQVFQQDLLKITNTLKNWLNAQSPELAKHLEEEIAKKSA